VQTGGSLAASATTGGWLRVGWCSVSLHLAETIAALGSAPGGSARGLVRLGGGELASVLARLVEPPLEWPTKPVATRVRLRVQGSIVPAELSLWPTARSYIGQPLAELNLPGSPPLLEAVLAACFEAGARPAERGEFTLRAFLSGRLDLPQAEAVLGVIEAETRAELTTALAQLGGGLGVEVQSARNSLLDLLADLEAGLDFADEHLEFVTHDELSRRLGEVARLVDRLLDRAAGRMRSRPIPRVVLAGPPNAGKSTLVNALAGRRVALVSDQAGTTRDYVSVEWIADGMAVELVDTAGWESSRGETIAGQAQSFRMEQWSRADLILVCTPADGPVQDDSWSGSAACPILKVLTKSDLLPMANASLSDPTPTRLPVSATGGTGLAALRQAILACLATSALDGEALVATTAARCREGLLAARKGLDRAIALVGRETDQELLAIEIREALDGLGRLVGAVYTDDLLDRIFSRFCIGK
jgi:tRNA modification GTPase